MGLSRQNSTSWRVGLCAGIWELVFLGLLLHVSDSQDPNFLFGELVGYPIAMRFKSPKDSVIVFLELVWWEPLGV